MEFDFEDLQSVFLNFCYKNKKIILISFAVILSIVASVAVFLKNDYESRAASSVALIEYIDGKNDDFLKKKHKKGYKLIYDILESRKTPSIEQYDKFASLDSYVFKNLFFFSKKLYFGYSDDYESYYFSDSNPWNKLVKIAAVFNLQYDATSLNYQDDYFINFLVGRGVKC